MLPWLEASMFKYAAKGMQARFNPNMRTAALYFHRILDNPDPFFPDDLTYANLRRLVRVLKTHFTFIGADEPVPKDTPALILSFDDGYADNYTYAMRLLEEEGVKATFFIATAGIEEGYLWQDVVQHALQINVEKALSVAFSVARAHNIALGHTENMTFDATSSIHHYVAGDVKFWQAAAVDDLVARLIRIAGEPPRCMMTSEQVKSLSAMGHTVGAHTHHHRILSTLNKDDAVKEIELSKVHLEAITQRPVTAFAYPNGLPGRDFSERDVSLVAKAGFTTAYTTADTGFDKSTPALERGRFLPYRKNPVLRALSVIKIAGESA